MLLSQATVEFLRYKVTRRGSTKTTEITYRSTLGCFVRTIGDKELSELTICDIDEYADKILMMDYKSKTSHNKLATVRSFIRYLYAKNLSDIRPESVELPKTVQTEANFLTYEEQTKLLDSIVNLRDLAIIQTMIAGGPRVSELLDLQYDDIHDKSIVIRCGKGGKPRVTFITESCSKALQAYLATKARSIYLFTNNRGERLSRQYVARIVTRYAEQAGITKHVSPHTLRHSFATNLLQNGARVEIVQPLMGHANIRTTLIYAHFTNPYLQSEYEKYSK